MHLLSPSLFLSSFDLPFLHLDSRQIDRRLFVDRDSAPQHAQRAVFQKARTRDKSLRLAAERQVSYGAEMLKGLQDLDVAARLFAFGGR